MRDPRIVKLALCGLLFIALLLLPPVPGLTPQGQQVLAVVAVATFSLMAFLLPSATMYLAQSSTAIMAYIRGHFTPRELLILGLAMTPLSYAVLAFVALPSWALLGQGLTP